MRISMKSFTLKDHENLGTVSFSFEFHEYFYMTTIIAGKKVVFTEYCACLEIQRPQNSNSNGYTQRPCDGGPKAFSGSGKDH